MQEIKNVIFDFGNVLFDLDLPAIPRFFEQKLGVEKAAAAREALLQRRVFELFETGGMSKEEFVYNLCAVTTPALDEQEVIGAWNAIFIDMPKARFDMLLALRQRYRVFLLSNINAIHEQWIAEYMETHHGIHDFEQRYFDGVYYSHLIRMRKPDAEIYSYMLADADILPEASIFSTIFRKTLKPPGSSGSRVS
ncbi:MAG: hypothetical protein IPL65_15860 [Lewinellaceae bacterium]|nr:hypothetical protein [Lewinellaceae bacterium]